MKTELHILETKVGNNEVTGPTNESKGKKGIADPTESRMTTLTAFNFFYCSKPISIFN